MLVPNKRGFLAGALRASGMLGLLERFGARPGLLVLTYHRIGDASATPFYAPVVSATPEAFRAQIRGLRRAYHVLTLEEAAGFVAEGRPFKRPAALVTFDDGTRDNAEVAAPILIEEGVPATFFLPTALIEMPRLPWYDHIAWVLRQAKPQVLRLDRPAPLFIDLSRTPRSDAIAAVIRACLAVDVDVNDEAGVLAHVEERAGARADSEALGRALFMGWDEARGLVRSGMSLGSHAHTHRKLAALDEAEQGRELTLSKATLQARIGREVVALAYPYGWAGAFDATTVRLAREAGYRLAFSSIEGVNRPGGLDPYALRRLNIGASDRPTMVRARLALQAAAGRSPI